VSRACRASIIISSHNYGRFLGQAIDSALDQSYPQTEVIVVDDGSLDNSREVIAGYGSRILPLLKNNEGQASAWNAGFALSRGDAIFFLDSDDVLLPGAVDRAMPFFQDAGVARVHWPLWLIDERGAKTSVEPRDTLPEGDLRAAVLRAGADGYTWPATSGNAWARTFLAGVLPMPEEEFKTSPDIYLSAIVPLFGRIQRVLEPQSCWRIHGQNNCGSQSFDERLREMFQRAQCCISALARYGRAAGLEVDAEVLRANSWWCRIHRASQDLIAIVPPGERFILVDNDAWTTTETLAGRPRIPFLERDGQYWGAPADDDTAVRELERLRQSGASFIVFGWPAFWWLDYYADFHRHLRSISRCVLKNDHLVVFDLRDLAERPNKRNTP
jgi:glycosyltransferase involved in cell wall biosynthesis